MKTATVRELKSDLKYKSQDELIAIVLRLSKFKKENKELLTYLLYSSENEDGYIQSVQALVQEEFNNINTHGSYWVKKSVRKILRSVKKYIRYSDSKETEVALLLHFCEQMLNISPSIKRNTVLKGIYERQLEMAAKKITALHEDLQHDYGQLLEKLQHESR